MLFCAPSALDFILQSRAVTVHRLCVQKRCTAEANLDEMQLPLDWQSHQMSFTLSWSILYTKRLFTTELQQSRMATGRPHCNLAQTSNMAAKKLHDKVGASVVTFLWQPSLMLWREIAVIQQDFLSGMILFFLLLFYRVFLQGQVVSFSIFTVQESWNSLIYLWISFLAFLLSVRWTDWYHSHICKNEARASRRLA